MNSAPIISDDALIRHYNPVEQPKAEEVIDALEAMVRTHGQTHRQLAELAKVDPAEFTLFMQRRWPTGWEGIAVKADAARCRELRRLEREAAMPMRTKTVEVMLGLAEQVIADGTIGVVQGDSGVGKSEGVRAISLQVERVVSVRALESRARPHAMLEDIARRLGRGYFNQRATADLFKDVASELQGCRLLIVDEAHNYLGEQRTRKCLCALRELFDETHVPQLWVATGDFMEAMDGYRGSKLDPFIQVRSRVQVRCNLDAKDARPHLIRPADVRQFAAARGLKLDREACAHLTHIASLDHEGGLRTVEGILNHAKRMATAGGVESVGLSLACRAMDKCIGERTRNRARAVVQAERQQPEQTHQKPREAIREAV